MRAGVEPPGPGAESGVQGRGGTTRPRVRGEWGPRVEPPGPGSESDFQGHGSTRAANSAGFFLLLFFTLQVEIASRQI